MNPFAELLVETVHAKLNGSLRVSHGEKKSIIYFRKGTAVYAVSNARALRLFNILLTRGRITQSELSRHKEFTNDLELAGGLVDGGGFSKEEIDSSVVQQIEAVIVDVLTWPGGEWVFSPMARSREDLVYEVDIHKLLIDYARCLPGQDVFARFRSVKEGFARVPEREGAVQLQPHESYVLSRFDERALTLEELRHLSSIPEAGMLQALYALWLGGLLVRRDWNSAFSAAKIEEIRSARFELVREASRPAVREPATVSYPSASTPVHSQPETALPDFTMPLDDYLSRVDAAETLYDLMGVDPRAEIGDIKRKYFAMAKLFHPDRFHREDAGTLRRIQMAFTELAHAYETLKSPESRENYDFKMRKELEVREKARAAGKPVDVEVDRVAESGLRAFETGVSLLGDEDYAAAAGQFARAVHYSPQNALYHAYYGKALAAEGKQRHKAEAEMQTAARIDPKNSKIRIMLAEFFVEMNMIKRAEGELKRFLEMVPGNKEAAAMLAGLSK